MNWHTITNSLNSRGYAVMENVLSEAECKHLAGLYDDNYLYRSIINMQRYRFGQGEYKYFNYPLPPPFIFARNTLFAFGGNRKSMDGELESAVQFPEKHDDFVRECQTKSQSRPTPLILRYESGGFNTLHQDMYGEIYFPFQVVFVLTQAGLDHEGGEFVLTEQIPRAQSKVEVLQPNQGDAVIFTTNFRPIKGTKGYYRAKMKHGVSEIKKGVRYSLSIIFHDVAEMHFVK